MYKVRCEYCKEDLILGDMNDKPAICSHCNTPLEGCRVVAMVDVRPGDDLMSDQIPEGLRLVYQTTGEKIIISHALETILGREQVGAEVFGKIPQISREHCKIEFIDNQYLVTDLNSINGTFTGISKNDCRVNPRQVLDDNSLLYLGREPFLINITHKSYNSTQPGHITTVPMNKAVESEPRKNQIHKCMSCGKEVLEKVDVCPHCQTFGTIEVFSV